MDADTPYRLLGVADLALNVGSSLHATTLTEGVLLVVVDIQVDAHILESIRHAGNGTVAAPAELDLLSIDGHHTVKDTLEVLGVQGLTLGGRRRRLRAVGRDGVVDEGEARVLAEEVRRLEELRDLLGEELAAEAVGSLLNVAGEGNLQATGEVQLKLCEDDPGSAALAALRVDADDGLVGAADVLGVQRKIWDLPLVLICLAFALAILQSWYQLVLFIDIFKKSW